MKKRPWNRYVADASMAGCVGLLLSIFVVTSCGYDESAGAGASGTTETGSFACNLTWPDDVSAGEDTSRTSRELNCAASGTDQVVFTFYDSQDELLVDPVAFDCIAHFGRVDKLPVGTGYRVIIAARDAFGNDLFRGTYSGFSIVAGGEPTTPPGGVIDMQRFLLDPDADVSNSLGMGFNFISAGTFTMGSPTNELGRGSNDDTPHPVTLTRDFYMQTTEVTQGQWQAVMGSNPSGFSACGSDCPVEQVSWNEVQDFIDALNSMGEGSYRLPTEAEWEYAARAGSTASLGNGSDIGVVDCKYDYNLHIMGWYCYNADVSYEGCFDNSGIGGHACSGTKPVGRKGSNAWGMYDMHGNVWEWVQDWWGVYTSSTPVTDPTGPASGTFKMIRGGGWTSGAGGCRSGSKNYDGASLYRTYIGFRLVWVP